MQGWQYSLLGQLSLQTLPAWNAWLEEKRLVEAEIPTACLPAKWWFRLAHDAGKQLLAWACVHLHPICAASNPTEEQ